MAAGSREQGAGKVQLRIQHTTHALHAVSTGARGSKDGNHNKEASTTVPQPQTLATARDLAPAANTHREQEQEQQLSQQGSQHTLEAVSSINAPEACMALEVMRNASAPSDCSSRRALSFDRGAAPCR